LETQRYGQYEYKDSVLWDKDFLTKFVSSNDLMDMTPELMLALEQYMAEHFKPLGCNM
jgi:hypothetical protein